MIAFSYLLGHWPRQECRDSRPELFASFRGASIEVYYFLFSFSLCGFDVEN